MLALWIDDEPAIMNATYRELTQMGVNVHTVHSPAAALEALANNPKIDVIITDLLMPNEAGSLSADVSLRLAEELRLRMPDTPLVAYTAFQGSIESDNHPFDRILSKTSFRETGNELFDILQDSIAAKISKKTDVDEKYIRDILARKDFEIISDLDGDHFQTNSKLFSQCVEVSNRINNHLLSKLSASPNLLFEIDDRRFEEICATILCRDGFHVHVTPKSGDGGYDILAFNNGDYLTSLYLVECKRYHPDKSRVGVPILRQLNGVVEEMNAAGGLLMTTSTFTQPAKEFANRPSVRMDLVDFFKLRSWMDSVKAK